MGDERNANATETEAESDPNTPKRSKEEKEATGNLVEFEGEIGIKKGNYFLPFTNFTVENKDGSVDGYVIEVFTAENRGKR